MIIQCEQCKTKFKLDDSKVPPKGVKVRCAKCRYVFSVSKEQPVTTEKQTDFGSMLDSSIPYGHEAINAQSEFAAPEDVSAIEFEDSAPIEMEKGHADLFPADTDSVEQGHVRPEENDMFPAAQVEQPTSIDEIDFGAFAFGAGDDEAPAVVPPTLDFGDTPKIQTPHDVSGKVEFGGLDFSGDDMFGEVVPPAPEDSTDTAAFDFGMDDFSASMGVNAGSAGQKNPFGLTDASSETPFSLDEIDFGDELTAVGVQHVSPEELKPSQELLFAPLAEAQVKSVPVADAGPVSKSPETKEELPPLSISSRRKQSSLFTGLVAVLGIAIAGIVAFYGYSMFARNKTSVPQEMGRITVSEVDARFVKNKLNGDLLVISGKAVNQFSKPRAAIQIKGMVYGAAGEVLSSKNAFCGNPLTDEQLSTMSMDKIEAVMANQFGDSLSNMEVAPGNAISFVIVMAKPIAAAKDYGVEPSGSTVATGKQ